MNHIALVLSAGGHAGDPWHAGVLAALHDETGWDPRTADLVVGTSAGSISGLALRAGMSAHDRYALHRGATLSPRGQALVDRIITPWNDDATDREWRPQAPAMSARAAWPPWRLRPVHAAVGLLPPGNRRTDTLETRMSELHPQRWPERPFWATAVRLDDGRRVVFGRDDVRATVAQAVRASCGVPGVYEPTTIGSRRYVDGGVHSSTNADLVAALAFDLVIVSSVMTAAPPVSGWSKDRLTRRWFGRLLANEVAQIRRRGTPVLVVQPTADVLERLEREPGPHDRADIAGAAHEATRRRLTARDGRGLASLLATARPPA
ncbi:MAG: patatin-like phospholipase family protein [Acidimicrobiales bacterium]